MKRWLLNMKENTAERRTTIVDEVRQLESVTEDGVGKYDNVHLDAMKIP